MVQFCNFLRLFELKLSVLSDFHGIDLNMSPDRQLAISGPLLLLVSPKRDQKSGLCDEVILIPYDCFPSPSRGSLPRLT